MISLHRPCWLALNLQQSCLHSAMLGSHLCSSSWVCAFVKEELTASAVAWPHLSQAAAGLSVYSLMRFDTLILSYSLLAREGLLLFQNTWLSLIIFLRWGFCFLLIIVRYFF